MAMICGCADNGSVRHWVLCVFFRKYTYMSGVDVLDKGCVRWCLAFGGLALWGVLDQLT